LNPIAEAQLRETLPSNVAGSLDFDTLELASDSYVDEA
jgi:hypothetical protein